MATTAPPKGKPASTRKASASRKASADDKGRPLLFRYHTIMKPQRVGTLVVEVPRSKRDSAGPGGVVVVRPVIAGAQVVPPEQRFDTSEPGNQVTFHVTPLARGRLPRARVEVHVAGRAPQDVPLTMHARTQRLSWVLLLLAFLLPWAMIKVTTGDWRPVGTAGESPSTALAKNVRNSMKENVAEIPVFNTKADLPLGLDQFTIADSLADGLEVGYKGLEEGVKSNRWVLVAAVGMLLLAFLSWSFHRPRQVRVRRRLELAAADTTSEPTTLQPL